MQKKYELRPDDTGRTGLYINDTLVIYNLDDMDRRNFNKEFGAIDLSLSNKSEKVASSDRNQDAAQQLAPRRGRKLLLAQHEGMIRDMIEHDPSMTAARIQTRLRAVGIKFSGISAVTNLARFYGLKLAA